MLFSMENVKHMQNIEDTFIDVTSYLGGNFTFVSAWNVILAKQNLSGTKNTPQSVKMFLNWFYNLKGS